MSTVDGMSGGWTYEQYFSLDDDRRHEVIDGGLLVVPAPGTLHQTLVGELFLRLREFTLAGAAGKVFLAPVDVILDPRDVVQPDLLFVRTERLDIVEPLAIRGRPDLVVEVVSASSVRRDRVLKSRIYAGAGVPEYWIVDPDERSIEVLSLRDGAYETFSRVSGSGIACSRHLVGFQVDLGELMAAACAP